MKIAGKDKLHLLQQMKDYCARVSPGEEDDMS